MISVRKTFQLLMALVVISSFSSCDRTKVVVVKKEKIGDVELAYYIRGHGEPLVMIMGFRGTMSLWDPALLEELEKKYTLILFDNRGAGLSSDSESPLSIQQMAEDTSHLIEFLGYKKVNVLGWSMGSRIALALTLKHPDQVKNLILCSPNPGGEKQALRKNQDYSKLMAKTLSPEDGLSLIFPNTSEGKKSSEAFMTRLTDAVFKGTVPADLQVSEEIVTRQIEALKLWNKDNDIYPALAGIKIPTLVTGGSEDMLDPMENAQMIAAQIPFAWSAYFPRAGHYFLSQEHEAFSELVKLFISSND